MKYCHGMIVMLQGRMAVLPNGLDVPLAALLATRPAMIRGGAVAGAAMELRGMMVWVLCARGGCRWGCFGVP
jgi:hypothetical protein